MKVVLFGATGMIGQAVLRECLLDPGVEQVLGVGRSANGTPNSKFREIVQRDLLDYTAVESQLSGFDACFFCLGVSSAGMSEAAYTRVTYDITVKAASTLARLNPAMTFIFVSGTGADSSERGRIMWARVKGRAENAVLNLPFRAVYIFRPGAIQPLHGIQSRTALYRVLYQITRPLLPALRSIFPDLIVTTEQIGRAMLAAARHGAPKRVLENRDIRALAQ